VLARSGRLHVLGRGEVVTVDKGLLPAAGPRTGPAASLMLAVPGEPASDTQLHRLRANDAFDLERRHPYR
jgi:hypothetical protein